MGLPIWREPGTKNKEKESAKVPPPNPIHRVRAGRITDHPSRNIGPARMRQHSRAPVRPDEIGRRRMVALGLADQNDWTATRPRSLYPPTLDVLRPQDNTRNDRPASRRTAEDYAGVPPISTLLDTADRRAPPPVPESRNYFEAERAAGNATTEARRPRLERGAVGERVRLIEETSRIVSSLARQNSPTGSAAAAAAAAATTGTEDGPLTEPPMQGDLRSHRDGAMTAIITDYLESNTRLDGLGDRNRSPTPPEEWEVMLSTIQPDATLPSAESSFTSAAASQSFTASSASTMVTDLADGSSRGQRSPDSADGSASSFDLTDVCADDDSIEATESLARDMYYREMETPEGRRRIADQEAFRAQEGNRFAMPDEAPSVDIGFRLIEAALERVEERHRSLRLRGQPRTTADYGPDLTRLSDIITDDRARQMATRHSHVAQEPETSNEAPEAHPVSPPDTRRQTEENRPLEVQDLLAEYADFVQSDQDMVAVRQIGERLSRRQDVPDDWWISMGLHFSRAQGSSDTLLPLAGASGLTTEDLRVRAEHNRRVIERRRQVREEMHERISRL